MTSSSRLLERGMRHVAAPLKQTTIDYMLAHMLPDGMKRSIGALAAKIIEDHVAAHQAACDRIARPLPTKVAPGWPDKSRLMAGR